jgi:ornithine cyclodeaminase/alanine dehydrogenase-like protein (mu-crystallin family)
VTLGATAQPSKQDTEHPPVSTAPYGSLTLMSTTGKPYGFISAEDLTAFRTALASSLLFTRRKRIRVLTVFGTGKQAYWHVRLALLLRGSTIRKVHFINRDFSPRATGIMKAFISFSHSKKKDEGWHDTTFDLTSLKYGEIGRILKDQVRAADVIFMTTPSTEPLFDHTILTNTEGRKRARLVICVGSYKPHMIELPHEVVTQAVKIHGHGHHFHKRAEEGGVIVVDTLNCVTEAGELVQAGIKPERTVELGELVMLEVMHHSDQDSAIDDDDESPHSPRMSMTVDREKEEIERLREQFSPDGISSLAKAFRENSIESSTSGSSAQSTSSAPTVGTTGSTTPTTITSKSPSRKSSFTSSLSRRSSFNKALKSRTGSLSLKKTSSGEEKKRQQTEKEDQMSRWLSGGNVIYKSVGLGLMDLVVGGDIVKLARDRGVGMTIEGF